MADMTHIFSGLAPRLGLVLLLALVLAPRPSLAAEVEKGGEAAAGEAAAGKAAAGKATAGKAPSALEAVAAKAAQALEAAAGKAAAGKDATGKAAPAGEAADKEEAAPPAPAPPTVFYVEVTGIVNPVMAEFIGTAIDDAEKARAEALILQLDTPGGLDLSMRVIIKRIFSSDVPIVVYVAPAGSRAASAGVFMTYSANVAAMAPGTNIGSASPVAMGGGDKMDETMKKKVTNDAVAYIKSIAAKRGRNAEWAEKAVREAVNITAAEALELGVIDMVVSSRAELMERLDGRRVELAVGERVMKTAGVEIKQIRMGFRHRILTAITNPNVAYILMMIGLLGLYFELSNPGAIFPGVIGAICLVLAFYAFQTLAINYAGLLLIGLAVIFFIVEVNVVSYGLLTIAGVVALILGSLMLFEAPAPFMKLSLWVILPTVVFMTGFILFTMYYVVSLHKRGAVSGSEGLVGETGRALDNFTERAGHFEGEVFVGGEYWGAIAAEPISEGEGVRVVEMEGLVLKVIKR